MNKNVIIFIKLFFLALLLATKTNNASAVCQGGSQNGSLNEIEICDVNNNVNGDQIISSSQARGGVIKCSDIGDTDATTKNYNLWCNPDCTIDYNKIGHNCTVKGFGSPDRPDNVPVSFEQAVLNITNWVLGFITSITVLALIWGGVLYTTSAGNESQAENGKNTIKYALIGLVICGLAYAFINVVVTTIL